MHNTLRTEASDREPPINLADDILRGADAIAEFVFGSAKYRRKIYYYASDAKIRMPVFRIGTVICARKTTLIQWIERQEGVR